MSKFENYLKTFDIGSTLTEEDMEKNHGPPSDLWPYGAANSCEDRCV